MLFFCYWWVLICGGFEDILIEAGETDDDNNQVLMRLTLNALLRLALSKVVSHSPDAVDQSTAPVLECR